MGTLIVVVLILLGVFFALRSMIQGGNDTQSGSRDTCARCGGCGRNAEACGRNAETCGRNSNEDCNQINKRD